MRKLLSTALALTLALAPAAQARPFNRALQNWQRIASIKKKITIAPTGPTGFATHWDQAAMWYTPIPAGVTYTNFHVSGDAGSTGLHAGSFGVDVNYEVTATNSDPLISWLQPSSWQPRTPGTPFTPAKTIRWPAAVNSSNTSPINYGGLADSTPGNTPNNPTIHYNATTAVVSYMTAATRVTSTSNLQAYSSSTGTHGGSQMSGGYITGAELDAGVIKHAIALNGWAAKYLSRTSGGFMAPALAADSYYNDGSANQYNGPNVGFRMGAHVALPAATNCSTLVSTTDARTICTALKTFGGYFVDDTFYDNYAINATPEAEARLYSMDSAGQAAPLFNGLQQVP